MGKEKGLRGKCRDNQGRSKNSREDFNLLNFDTKTGIGCFLCTGVNKKPTFCRNVFALRTPH